VARTIFITKTRKVENEMNATRPTSQPSTATRGQNPLPNFVSYGTKFGHGLSRTKRRLLSIFQLSGVPCGKTHYQTLSHMEQSLVMVHRDQKEKAAV
jgi:hypothetical protein